MAGSSEQRRVLLGAHLTVQAVALVLAALGVTTLLAWAVLTWLENMA